MPSPLPSLILLPGTPPPSTLEVKDIKSLWPLPGGYCLVDIFSLDEELSALRVTTELPRPVLIFWLR